jgi:serine/threonine protein kinase
MEILRALPPHENIVQLRYYAAEQESEDKNDRLLTLFMDYLPSNLHHVIQEHATGMPLFLIQIYSRQLLGGLQHLAKHNIVHRDLLPRNILIDPDTKSLKLADFGCAKAITSDSPNHPNVGTFQYRALELLFGATIYNCKAGISFNMLF